MICRRTQMDTELGKPDLFPKKSNIYSHPLLNRFRLCFFPCPRACALDDRFYLAQWTLRACPEATRTPSKTYVSPVMHA